MAHFMKSGGDAGSSGLLTAAESPAAHEEEAITGAIHQGPRGGRLGEREVEPGEGEDQTPKNEACNK